MAYNTTFMDTSNNFVDILDGLNIILDGKLALIILFIVGIVMFVSMRTFDTKATLVSSGAVLGILMGMFVFIGWINIGFLLIPIVIFLAGLVWSGADS